MKEEKPKKNGKNKTEKKETSLLTKRVFASLRQLCAKDDRYSIDRFDDRALKTLSVASEKVALSSIDTLRKHPAASIKNPSALLTKTLARLKRELSTKKTKKEKKSPSRPERDHNATTDTNEFLTPKKKSDEKKYFYTGTHTVSVSRRRGGGGRRKKRGGGGKKKEAESSSKN